jgi:FAD/FMN-containing dehydrogenase
MARATNSNTVWRAVKRLKKLLPTVLEVYDQKTAEILFELRNQDIEDSRFDTQGFLILIEFSGPKQTVSQQILETTQICKSCDLTLEQTCEDHNENQIWQGRTSFFSLNDKTFFERHGLKEAIGIKLVVPKDKAMDLALQFESLIPRYKLDYAVLHQGALGISYAYLAGLGATEFLRELKTLSLQLEGRLQVRTGPVELRKEYCFQLSNYGKEIKSIFDPKGIINFGKCP